MDPASSSQSYTPTPGQNPLPGAQGSAPYLPQAQPYVPPQMPPMAPSSQPPSLAPSQPYAPPQLAPEQSGDPVVPSSNEKQQFIEHVRKANNVLVTVSNNPSVDQLTAAIGLTLLLNKLGKHAAAVYAGETPRAIDFLRPDLTFEKNSDSLRDFIIALDKSKADKLRYKVEDTYVKIFITPYHTSLSESDLEFSQGDYNIDVIIALGIQKREEFDQSITSQGRIMHDAVTISVSNTVQSDIGTINWLQSSASSLCEMIVGTIEPLQGDKALLDTQISTALLTGIVSETERFSNDKTTPLTMNVSALLMKAGANQQLVASKLQAPAPAPAPETDQLVDQLSSIKLDELAKEVANPETVPEPNQATPPTSAVAEPPTTPSAENQIATPEVTQNTTNNDMVSQPVNSAPPLEATPVETTPQTPPETAPQSTTNTPTEEQTAEPATPEVASGPPAPVPMPIKPTVSETKHEEHTTAASAKTLQDLMKETSGSSINPGAEDTLASIDIDESGSINTSQPVNSAPPLEATPVETTPQTPPETAPQSATNTPTEEQTAEPATPEVASGPPAPVPMPIKPTVSETKHEEHTTAASAKTLQDLMKETSGSSINPGAEDTLAKIHIDRIGTLRPADEVPQSVVESEQYEPINAVETIQVEPQATIDQNQKPVNNQPADNTTESVFPPQVVGPDRGLPPDPTAGQPVPGSPPEVPPPLMPPTST